MLSNWSVIGPTWNKESEELMEYIKQRTGCEPKFFALYSTMMAFIRHAGISEDRPVAFRNGHLLGTIDNIKRILQPLDNVE